MEAAEVLYKRIMVRCPVCEWKGEAADCKVTLNEFLCPDCLCNVIITHIEKEVD